MGSLFEHIKSIKGKLFEHIKRVWFECLLLFLMGVGTYFTSGMEGQPALRLFMYKVLLFSASQIHAHITRQIIFPYINFLTADNGQRAMVVAIHVAAAYIYAQGG